MQHAELLESGLLRDAGFRHGFFTRRGGVSSGAYASLNFSVTVGDAGPNVQTNLARAAEALGVDPERVYYLSQVHGRDVSVLAGGEQRESVLEQRGDALVSRARGVACGVRIADCVPILIADARSRTVAAVRAGWRGAVAGVVGSAISALRRVAGDDGELVAAIGPHISAAAFEVGDDVAEQLSAAAPGVAVVDRRRDKPHVDLRLLVRAQLCSAGLRDAAIDDVSGCTLSEPELYFSFRRDGPKSGRHLAAIVPGP